MPKIWELSNFSLGIHTEPGRVQGGERYAADLNNLMVDEDGWLILRSNFKTVGPGGAPITGIAASNTHLFILRNTGRLYCRPLDDLTDEQEIEGVHYLSGRLSVVSAYRDYIMLTSEGDDQGFWVDFREGKPRVANTLGINVPTDTYESIGVDGFTWGFNAQSWIDDRPAFGISVVDSLDGQDGTTGPKILVAYAISFVRQFEAGLGEVQPDELFNGMESNYLSNIQPIILRRPVINDDKSNFYQIVTFDFSTLINNRPILPSHILSRQYKFSSGVENTHFLRIDSPGGIRIGYTEIEEGDLLTRLTSLENGEKIVCRTSSGSDVIITLTAANAVVDTSATPQPGGFISIDEDNYTQTGTFLIDAVYALYPANADGSLKYITTCLLYTSPSPRDS